MSVQQRARLARPLLAGRGVHAACRERVRCHVCRVLPCLQSSHKLQVVVVCEEALPRITYSARTVDVGPVTEHLASEMVKEAQPSVSEVRASLGDPGCHAALSCRIAGTRPQGLTQHSADFRQHSAAG